MIIICDLAKKTSTFPDNIANLFMEWRRTKKGHNYLFGEQYRKMVRVWSDWRALEQWTKSHMELELLYGSYTDIGARSGRTAAIYLRINNPYTDIGGAGYSRSAPCLYLPARMSVCFFGRRR